jgi:hypothetical protein
MDNIENIDDYLSDYSRFLDFVRVKTREGEIINYKDFINNSETKFKFFEYLENLRGDIHDKRG